jgi:flagellin
MGFRINHNVPSVQALGSLDKTTLGISKSLMKLSTGLRIVKAGDDASGLVISERMRAQVGGLNTAKLNAEEGISMLSTAEGALNEINSMLLRMRDLAIRASQDVTLGTVELGEMDAEDAALAEEIDRISAYVKFNGKVLFDGTLAGSVHVGPNAAVGVDDIAITIAQLDATTLAINANDLTTGANALTAIGAIDGAIDSVSDIRGDLGVLQNRLEHTIANIDVMIENTVASESRIRDVDMAAEISNFTRLQILQQSGTAMLAQANAQPQAVLSLLQG